MSLLDPLSKDVPIVDPATGFPTAEFLRKWSIQRAIKVETDSLLLALATSIGDASASGLFRVRSVTPTAGAEATIALEVRAGTGESYRTASILLSALAGVLSRIELNADNIVLNGTVLSSGGIITGHIGTNAVTLPGHKAGSGTVAAAAASAWTLIDSFTDTFTAKPVSIDIGLDLDNTDAGDHTFNVALTYDSTDPTVGTPPLYDAARSYLSPKSPAWFPYAKPVSHTPGTGSHTYRLYFKSDSTAVRARIWDLKYAEIRR